MKWLVGLFLVWITLRNRFPLYSGFATGAKIDAKENSPISQLEGLMNILGN